MNSVSFDCKAATSSITIGSLWGLLINWWFGELWVKFNWAVTLYIRVAIFEIAAVSGVVSWATVDAAGIFIFIPDKVAKTSLADEPKSIGIGITDGSGIPTGI